VNRAWEAIDGSTDGFFWTTTSIFVQPLCEYTHRVNCALDKVEPSREAILRLMEHSLKPRRRPGLSLHLEETRHESSLHVILEMKARQAAKIRELGHALVDAGFLTLDDQSKALGSLEAQPGPF
jgi:hypothetical protein